MVVENILGTSRHNFCQRLRNLLRDVWRYRHLEVQRSIALGLMTRRNLPIKISASLKRTIPKTPTNRRGNQLSNTKDVRLGNKYF